jgi:hypothetical protein
VVCPAGPPPPSAAALLPSMLRALLQALLQGEPLLAALQHAERMHTGAQGGLACFHL